MLGYSIRCGKTGWESNVGITKNYNDSSADELMN